MRGATSVFRSENGGVNCTALLRRTPTENVQITLLERQRCPADEVTTETLAHE